MSINPEQAAALALAETILQHGAEGVDTPLSPLHRSVAADSINWLGSVPPDLPRKEAYRAAVVGATKGGELEADGVLEAFNDGARVRITSRSIARRRIALAILSHPIDGPRTKIREPAKRFQRRVRPRTEAELQGLARANAARAREAALRREGKAKTERRARAASPNIVAE